MRITTTAYLGKQENLHTPAIFDCAHYRAQSPANTGLARSTPRKCSGPQTGHGQAAQGEQA